MYAQGTSRISPQGQAVASFSCGRIYADDFRSYTVNCNYVYVTLQPWCSKVPHYVVAYTDILFRVTRVQSNSNGCILLGRILIQLWQYLTVFLCAHKLLMYWQLLLHIFYKIQNQRLWCQDRNIEGKVFKNSSNDTLVSCDVRTLIDKALNL